MNLKPVLTEKSLEDAKRGKYTFWVSKNLNKYQARKLINEAFGVHVTSIKSINYKSVKKRSSMTRRTQITPSRKKVFVTLSEKEKIDIFGEEKKK
jgi:large subunit ribosomal protein L23